jgi:Ca2+-binding RTX toxin-like protein
MAAATAREQLLLELINRARMDPEGEARRFGIDLNKDLAAGTITSDPKQVLAFNSLLNDAADDHSHWMLSTSTFSHTGAGGSDPGERMEDAGYAFTGSWTWGENIAWSGTTGTLNADLAVIAHHQNLFISAGHRENLLSDSFREVGLGCITGSFRSGSTTYNALMTTQDFARSGARIFVTGVNYRDSDLNDFYSIGEGVGGRTVQVLQEGSVIATTTSSTAGGYALGLTVSGLLELHFSGGQLADTMGVEFRLGESNVKIDMVNSATILSNVSATLTGASEGLKLIGIRSINGTGNGLANTITGNDGANDLAGLGGADSLRGRIGEDTLAGGGGDDRVAGGQDDDEVEGGEGVDFVIGGEGADTVAGGLGNDRLRGGDGADLFRFDDVADSEKAGDTIVDFEQGSDRLDLSAIDAVTGSGDQAFSLLAPGERLEPGMAAGKISVFGDAEVTHIKGDVNGDGLADFHIVLHGAFTLTAADFIL